MAGRLAIDFGTSNTRAAVWVPALNRAEPLAVPDVSLRARYEAEDGEIIEIPYVPSLINYSGKQRWIGKQVRDKGLMESPTTFRWMKRYISNRLEIPRRIDGGSVKFSEAGEEFLSRVLIYAGEAVDMGDEEVAFTVPVEAFEHYQDWITRVCENVGIRRYRLLDEASAAALGYGLQFQSSHVFMVFDFGGGTLDVSVVRMEKTAAGGKRCTVLGKGGSEIGGTTIDNWLYRDLLERNDKEPEDVRHISTLLLMEVERAKETLTTAEKARVTVADPETGDVLIAEHTRSSFETILEKNGLFQAIHSTVDRALADARERGYDRDHIEAVLLVGGSSLIPSVRKAMTWMFGERVRFHRPLDAVALGAAAFVSGIDFYDHIQHDYALRYYNREKGEHDFFPIVQAGTEYPTNGPARTVTVSGSYDEQEYLGLEIYEIGRKQSSPDEKGAALDLVFDPSGAARFQKREEPEITSHYWINEKSPTFIHALPKAKRGDKRFPVQFSIDGNKRLCVTVRDAKTGKLLMQDHPVVKLT